MDVPEFFHFSVNGKNELVNESTSVVDRIRDNKSETKVEYPKMIAASRHRIEGQNDLIIPEDGQDQIDKKK